MPPHRLLLAALAVTLVLPGAPAHATPPAGPAKVRLLACVPAVEPTARYAVFESEMRGLPGFARLQVRFTLEARTPDDSGWSRVAAPGFGAWVAASPGVRRFVYTKRIENLVAPGHYRVVAKFRWLNAAGAIVGRELRRSGVCRQPDQRPDLTATRIDVDPGSSSDTRTYVIPLVNRGRTRAPGVAVRLIVNDEPQPLATLGSFAPGEQGVLGLAAPACRPGTSITAIVDPGGLVDEADETDNVLTVACPLQG